MKNFTVREMEDCIYENKINKEWFPDFRNIVRVESFTQIDDKYVVIEVERTKSREQYNFLTCDMEKGNTITMVSDNRDMQILITLGLKYDWLNSQFADYAQRMLNINN